MKRLIFASVLLLGGNVCLAERSIQECKERVAAIEALQSTMNKVISGRRHNGRAQTNFSRGIRLTAMISRPVTQDGKNKTAAFKNMHHRRATV